jgi:hypothetical protein
MYWNRTAQHVDVRICLLRRLVHDKIMFRTASPVGMPGISLLGGTNAGHALVDSGIVRSRRPVSTLGTVRHFISLGACSAAGVLVTWDIQALHSWYYHERTDSREQSAD